MGRGLPARLTPLHVRATFRSFRRRALRLTNAAQVAYVSHRSILMRLRLKHSTARAMLLHLLVLVGVSLAGLHVHHHGSQADIHVAAGSHCSEVCHETCTTESTADHLFEILGSAAFIGKSGDLHAQIQPDRFEFLSPILATGVDINHAGESRFRHDQRLHIGPALQFTFQLRYARFPGSPRAPPAFPS